MTNQEKIIKMIKMQTELNKLSGGESWYNHEYWRAVWTESAELMNYIQWEWWKTKNVDKQDIYLELVDIWHFGLSCLIAKEELIDLTTILFNFFEYSSGKYNNIVIAIEELIYNTIKNRSFPISIFVGICNTFEFSFNQLYNLYIAKNILNKFRQDHGYNNHQYRKIWNGEEDNKYLLKILAENDNPNETLIYQKLEEKYALICQQN